MIDFVDLHLFSNNEAIEIDEAHRRSVESDPDLIIISDIKVKRNPETGVLKDIKI